MSAGGLIKQKRFLTVFKRLAKWSWSGKLVQSLGATDRKALSP